jgi:hypothetical protein
VETTQSLLCAVQPRLSVAHRLMEFFEPPGVDLRVNFEEPPAVADEPLEREAGVAPNDAIAAHDRGRNAMATEWM